MRGYPVYGMGGEEPVWSRNEGMSRGTSHHSVVHVPTVAVYPSSYGGFPPQAAMIQSTNDKNMNDGDIYKVGIYGWRKRFLYIFILVLTIAIVLNLALTVWIMSVLDFSTDGIGALKIEDDGISVKGKAQFERPLHFSHLSTVEDETLIVDSFKGVQLQARNSTGAVATRFSLLPEGKAQVVCDRFEIFDEENKLLFFADSNEIGLKLENLRILDDGGSVFEGAIQTSFVRPQPDTPLRLESPTRSVTIDAAQDIELMAAAGEISLNSLLDISLASKQGEIRLESSQIYMEKLQRSDGRGSPQLQLCTCHNGRLFLAAPTADCRADNSICR